jgi:3-carboxy-cis,cis-muconate cycloisomerase
VGEQGLALMTDLAQRLHLHAPDVPWHTTRDRLAHVAATAGIAVGSCGKIARDLALLAQTEIAEAREAPAAGRGGSSTMPHKQNPVCAATIITASLRAPGLVATMLQAMPQEHERGLGGWHAEWQTLPDLMVIAAGAARATHELLATLVVDPARMRANLESTSGLLMAEAVAMALAERIGKSAAHTLVESATRRAVAEQRALRDVLITDPQMTAHLREQDIDRLLTPDNYLGSARTFVERVLARHEASVAARD